LLRGLTYNLRLTKEDNAKALELYQKALKFDPEYVDAYVMIGGVYYQDWGFQWSEDSQTFDRALESERKAIALNDSNPEAHAILGRLFSLRGDNDNGDGRGRKGDCARSLFCP
jgi:Tfp pilus assembly protein PilF